jgi:hypothetical protein
VLLRREVEDYTQDADQMRLDKGTTRAVNFLVEATGERISLTRISGRSRNCKMTFRRYSKLSASSPFVLAPRFNVPSPGEDDASLPGI